MQVVTPGPLTAVGGVPTRWRVWLRRLKKILLVWLVLFLVGIGPWPADNSSYVDSSYHRESINALNASPILWAPTGPIRVGVAEVDISPPAGHPLAGYSARQERGYREIASPCFARALTIASGDTRATILTADILLINTQLARAVLDRTGVSETELYFTASHTHSGPGAWGERTLEKLITGPYDPQFFNTLADQLADVVTRSRAQLTPAEVGVIAVPTTARQTNRLEWDAPLDDRLLALAFRRAEEKPDAPRPLLATLVVFSAHPTVCGYKSNDLSADYPGELVAALRKRTGCPHVLFAAGAVGEASPARFPGTNEQESARLLGHALADDLAAGLADIRFERQVSLAAVRVPIDLPGFRVPVGPRWRVSPVCSSWVSDRHTHLQGLRIGSAVLVGFPGDYSGRLAKGLAEWGAARGLTLVPTSFNGDYKGYFVSEQSYMNVRSYETRDMNFFGPWAGEYLADLSKRMVERLAP